MLEKINIKRFYLPETNWQPVAAQNCLGNFSQAVSPMNTPFSFSTYLVVHFVSCMFLQIILLESTFSLQDFSSG
jgi:hypothetical protein